MFVYSSRGKWVFPSLLWSFPPSTTLTSFHAPGCWAHAPTPAGASPAHPACLFTVPGRIPFPQSSALSAPHPLSHVSLLFLLLITQFLFFSWVEVGLSRGLCCSGPWLSVGVPHTVKLTLSASSQAVWVRVTPVLCFLKCTLVVQGGGCHGVSHTQMLYFNHINTLNYLLFLYPLALLLFNSFQCIFLGHLQRFRSGVFALQVWSPKFKPHSLQKKKPKCFFSYIIFINRCNIFKYYLFSIILPSYPDSP
jgi:hypothetical protein